MDSPFIHQIANEVSESKSRYEEYVQFEKENSEISKRVRGEASRYGKSKGLSGKMQDLPTTVENVISAYINHNRSVDYNPAMVHLCGPFVVTLEKESEVYFSFERLMQVFGKLLRFHAEFLFLSSHLHEWRLIAHSHFIQLDDYFSQHDLNERVANFLMLFRLLLPEVHNHLEEEDIDFKEWATSWCQFLLSKELPLNCVLRLWDTYFSAQDGIQMHVFVCLAILRNLEPHFAELEQSEIRALLLKLPQLDMDQIISQAYDIKDEVMERQLSNF
jgi:TBC1 domain family member 2